MKKIRVNETGAIQQTRRYELKRRMGPTVKTISKCLPRPVKI